MKRILIPILVVCLLIALIWAGTFYWRNLRGIGPALNNPPSDIADVIPGASTTTPPAPPTHGENTTGIPLKLPPGFSISIFAKNLPGARVMAFDSFGNMWVSRTSEGIITSLEVQNGKVVRQDDVFKGLRKPHGLAFEPAAERDVLYYAEEDKISQVTLYSDAKSKKNIDLPAGGGHYTRTLGFGLDGRLYVSIGSSCNVCHEKDARRAAIWSLNKDGSDFKLFAKGLRNSVFFGWHPETKKMWATDMGRDLLGDDIPSDEINIIEEGKNYGWPTCYGKNIHDAEFDHNTYIRNPCMEPFETQSMIDIPAHSAPLGLAFIYGQGWPAEFDNSLLVAYHGSWNRSVPSGYKVVRMKFDANGTYQGAEDFITGWLVSKSEALGRPVDILALPDGTAYISDDKAGVIYKITAPKM